MFGPHVIVQMETNNIYTHSETHHTHNDRLVMLHLVTRLKNRVPIRGEAAEFTTRS